MRREWIDWNSFQTQIAFSWTPLHYAVWYSHLDCVGTLLSFGDGKVDDFKARTFMCKSSECDVNARTRNGSTPLHFAAKTGAVHVVELLMSHARVELDATDNDGKTPLQICEVDARQCAQECAEILRAAEKRNYMPKVRNEEFVGLHLIMPQIHRFQSSLWTAATV